MNFHFLLALLTYGRLVGCHIIPLPTLLKGLIGPSLASDLQLQQSKHQTNPRISHSFSPSNIIAAVVSGFKAHSNTYAREEEGNLILKKVNLAKKFLLKQYAHSPMSFDFWTHEFFANMHSILFCFKSFYHATILF